MVKYCSWVRISIIGCLLLITFIASGKFAFALDTRKLLPTSAEMDGWEVIQNRLIRDDTGLFSYMNGGAELYRAFNFKNLAVREFEGRESGVIQIELFRFKTDADAFGLYSMFSGGEKVDMGDEAYYDIGVLRIWQGHYYIRIMMEQNFLKYEPLLMRAGKLITGRIDEHGEKPALLNLLPPENLASTGGYFFHEHIVLKNLIFISTDNIFGLNRQTDAVLGEYRSITAEIVQLLLIKYPDDMKAKRAYELFVKQYMNMTPPSGQSRRLKKLIDGYRNVEVDLLGTYLLVGFEDTGNELLSQKMREMKKLVESALAQ